ncbi:MAG: hypothetical protein Q9186_004030 [Xanthomendoza sp. 1 TL-2023]
MSKAKANIQKNLPVARSFEDGRTPPPVQVFFPSRRHNSKTKSSSNSVTPADKWRQQTLTQLTPSLSRMSSSLTSFEEDSNLEYEIADAIMPPKKKQRRSSKLPPQRQTITQMDPFRAQLYPEEDTLDLEEDALTVTGSPSPRKKRKSTSATPRTRTVQRSATKRETRSATKRAAEATIKNEVEVSPAVLQPAETIDRSMPKRAQRMPWPQTPKTVRRKIVPSSQSPAETPWSSHEGSKKKLKNVTPLGERSVNTPSKVRLCSRRKSVQWAPKLEVADSTDLESVDVQLFSPVTGKSHTAANAVEKPISPAEIPKESPFTQSERTPAISYMTGVSPSSRPPYRNVKTEKQETIADSDEDVEDLFIQTFGEGDNDEAIMDSRVPDSPNQNKNTSVSESLRVGEQELQQAPHPHGSENVNNDSFETVPTQELSQPIQNSYQAQTPSNTSGQFGYTEKRSDADKASSQLTNELLLSSSPAPVQRAPYFETESQFENAWRDYSPPIEENSDPQAEEHGIEPETQAHRTSYLSTQQTLSSTNLHALPSAPRSQATTNDTTQASFRSVQKPHQGCVHNAPSRIPKSPSSQQQALSSSSPFQSRREPAADTYMGYQGWNGVPMTDSQLLPDSLLDDSLGMPLSGGIDADLELEMER